MVDLPAGPATFQRRVAALHTRAGTLAASAWAQVSPTYLSESWRAVSPWLVSQLGPLQAQVAAVGSAYAGETLSAQGVWVAPEAWVNPGAFTGWSSSGLRLEEQLYSSVITTKKAIANGVGTAPAMAAGAQMLRLLSGLQVVDAGRVAAGVDIAARPGVGYVRMVNSGACDRCLILAGKRYRWNTGFRRHPNCNCVHVATTQRSTAAAKAEGFVDDPYEYFESLSAAQQDRMFGPGNAQAIRDGGDIYQVVNSRRGRRGAFTTEGTTRRGFANSLLRPGQRRMTPETIYRLSHGDREAALQALREQGYILPGGQVPGGSLVGRVEGSGALGRGGTRVAASQAVRDARLTGVRDTLSRYTMTEAERRLFDAEQRYITVLGGQNPFTPGRPLTPQVAALVEKDYRRWLATGGQIF